METVVVAGNGKILIPNYIKSLRGILKGGNLAEDFKANRKEEFGLELKKSRKLKIHAEK